MKLSENEIERFIDMALAEDLGRGDITTDAIVPKAARLSADMRCREDIVVAGIDIALAVFRRLARDCHGQVFTPDGCLAVAGTTLAHIEGPARALLSAERTALNIIQHLSGIATLTRAYVERIAGTGATLLDSRKTIPGMRLLAKYATAVGGATNHRLRLDGGVLIKDNHIAVCGGIAAAVEAAKAARLEAIEVECDSLEQVEEALTAGANRLLLDNMDLGTLRKAVAIAGGRASLEASGGVTLETVREIAEAGVDFISVGRITHSAPAADIGLDFSSSPAARK